MNEKEIKENFVKHLDEFGKVMNIVPDLRLYARELPVYTSDGTKYADIVVSIEEHENPLLNQLIIMEWKKGIIDTGAIEQCERYARNLQKQLWRKQEVIKMIASSEGFSNFELNMCKEHNFRALKYDPSTNKMELEI